MYAPGGGILPVQQFQSSRRTQGTCGHRRDSATRCRRPHRHRCRRLDWSFARQGRSSGLTRRNWLKPVCWSRTGWRRDSWWDASEAEMDCQSWSTLNYSLQYFVVWSNRLGPELEGPGSITSQHWLNPIPNPTFQTQANTMSLLSYAGALSEKFQGPVPALNRFGHSNICNNGFDWI